MRSAPTASALTVKSFSGSDLKDGKLTVEVKFGSDSHKITFSAGAGGSLKATLADGSELKNEQNVPEGSNITFTAEPSGSKGVEELDWWTASRTAGRVRPNCTARPR